jgi:NADH-quinone oxidoreductase subunit G
MAQLHQPNLFIASTYPTHLDEEAWRAVCAPPDDLVRCAFAVWEALAGDPLPEDLTADCRRLVDEAARALLTAQRPLVTVDAACGSPALLEAAANIAWRLKQMGRAAELFFGMPECNSMGLALMEGLDLEAAFGEVAEERADTVIILENDLYRRADAASVDALLQKARRVIVVDHLTNATSRRADLVLPAATFAEAAGTLVNNEGRAQRHYAVMPPGAMVRSAWRWLQALAQTEQAGHGPIWRAAADVIADLAAAMPVFQAAAQLGPPKDRPAPDDPIARQAHRYTGRTAMTAQIDVHEPKPPEDPDSPLVFSMEGRQVPPPAGLIPRYWAPGWNSVQSLNKFQSEIGGPLRDEDPGRRLIAPVESDAVTFFAPPAAGLELKGNEFQVIPMHHIFGSDELSMGSPAVAQRAPEPYLALAPNQADVSDGDRVRVDIEGNQWELPVRLMAGLPPRTAGLPVGLPAMPGLSAATLPKVLTFSKRS